MDGPPPPRELPLGKAVLLLVVGGEDDDTVVAVTEADEGWGGLIGRIEADMVLCISSCAVCQRFGCRREEDCRRNDPGPNRQLKREELHRWRTNRDRDRRTQWQKWVAADSRYCRKSHRYVQVSSASLDHSS